MARPRFDSVRPKAAPAAPTREPVKLCCCGCGQIASIGVETSMLLGKPGRWYAAECFWKSADGVEMARERAAEANEGADGC